MKGWKVGSVTVTPVIEINVPMPGRWLLPEATPENLAPYTDWLRPHFMDEESRIFLTIQAFLVESKGRKIIVDTCIGNGKSRQFGAFDQLDTPFLDHITDAGFPPEKVDTVVCTHLHVDHVGWNTKFVDGVWVPTFPNARYVMARTDYDYWATQSDDPGEVDVFADSIKPVFEAGLVDLVDPDHQITRELRFLPTPGHTPGHCSVTVSSGDEAIITGDLIHHPSQCMHPEWECRADIDPDQARRTRLAFLQRYADSGILVIGTHWNTPTAMHIVGCGDRWRVAVVTA